MSFLVYKKSVYLVGRNLVQHPGAPQQPAGTQAPCRRHGFGVVEFFDIQKPPDGEIVPVEHFLVARPDIVAADY